MFLEYFVYQYVFLYFENQILWRRISDFLAADMRFACLTKTRIEKLEIIDLEKHAKTRKATIQA